MKIVSVTETPSGTLTKLELDENETFDAFVKEMLDETE